MPGTIHDLLPLRAYADAAERYGTAHVKILPRDKLVEMNVGIYTPTENAYLSDGMYSPGGPTGSSFAPALSEGHYLVIYKIDGWESSPRARGSTLENVRQMRGCYVSISAREYEALRDILANPTPENIERARKRVEIILNDVLLNPQPQRALILIGPFVFKKKPQQNYAAMLGNFLQPDPPKRREVALPRH